MKGKRKQIRNSTAEFLIFTAQGGEGGIEVRYEDETIWLSQKLMATLFDVTVPTINEHLKNIFASREVDENSAIRKFRTTAADGKSYGIQFYNLDAIISVGYRVNSRRATQFRQWATRILREFAIKGYVLDRKRMENGSFLGEDYFERLLEEVREIRLSERRFYQKITDIYATSIDYNKDAPGTREFFAKVQNKLHFAIHGHTAAELIHRPLAEDSPLLAAPFGREAEEFLQLHGDGRAICEQDRALYALCRPERLLQLTYQNILFDNGAKKIARYQQFFAVADILKRIRGGDPEEPRAGGVVWHTQGSGKSLTMVMMAKALALAPDILTPKVILVTDRIDLDDQICGTFRACWPGTRTSEHRRAPGQTSHRQQGRAEGAHDRLGRLPALREMTYQGTGMKGQLVAPDKATALLYKSCFDEFAQVRIEILMSGPNATEGEDGEKQGVSKDEKAFWGRMMDRYGSEHKYNKQLINGFKKGDEPEIIIVVDKLLTGFDAPCNTVLYLARSLKGHTLLQAIARVNRLFDGKEYGLILDYSGVIEDLDEAIDFYAQLADFDESDLAETIHFVEEEAARLPQYHSDLWQLFPGLKGKADPEMFARSLRDEEKRSRFYDRFSQFARTLSMVLEIAAFHPLPQPYRYVSGETLIYLGRQYRLRVVRAEPVPVKLRGRFLHVPVAEKSDIGNVRSGIEAWYRRRANDVFARSIERCSAIANRHGAACPALTIRKMRTRWGSCSAKRRMMLNLYLVQVPVHCIDYVVMHELCHTVEHNHSKAFYRLLTMCMPDWERRKTVLNRFSVNPL